MTESTRTVLCFGDSNTHGTVALTSFSERHRFAPETRWPGVLAAELGPGWHVIEEGHPGRTTVHDDPVEGAHKNGLTMLPALLESHRPIDVVTIMLGTNDLKARFSVTPQDIARSVERLARLVLASDVGPDGGAPAVILMAPSPIEEVGLLAEMFAGGQAKSMELADDIAAVAADLGLPFLDAGRLAHVDPVDGIHLMPDGHRAIGRAVAGMLKTMT